MAIAVSIAPKSPAPRTIRYRFRKAWRSVLFLALIPFFLPDAVGALIGMKPDIIKFFSGVLVLVPLSTFVEVVTEDLIERMGQFVGGLLHAFFSNAAFFVLTAATLIEARNVGGEEGKSLVTIVQSSIAGTVVVDILFILGIAIFVGGMRNGRMQFSPEISNQYSEMLTVAIIALALPTLAVKIPITVGLNSPSFIIDPGEASTLSNITAGVLIVAYIGYLGWTVFKFRDKVAVPESPEVASAAIRGDEYGVLAPLIAPIEAEQQRAQLATTQQQGADTLRRGKKVVSVPVSADAAQRAIAIREQVNARLARSRSAPKQSLTAVEAEARDKNIGIELWELGILILGTACIVFISEQMAHSIRAGLLNADFLGRPINEFFLGFIVIPVAANLVELSGAINTAWHDRLETCLAITAGSAIQVALLVAPLLVIVGHVIGLQEMNLIFGLFILAIFALIAYLFQLITVDGETTWLEGLQFSSFFAVLVVVAFFAGGVPAK